MVVISVDLVRLMAVDDRLCSDNGQQSTGNRGANLWSNRLMGDLSPPE